MKNILLLGVLYLITLSTRLIADDDIIGFWKSIDEDTNKAQSIVAVYEHEGKYYGRIVVTFDETGKNVKDTIYDAKERAPGVIGNPYYAGLDIIWDLKKNESKYKDGEVVDPQEGKIYGAELWRDGPDLIVRGKLLFFGRNQTWPRAQDTDFPAGFKKPDLASLVPTIPEVKEE